MTLPHILLVLLATVSHNWSDQKGVATAFVHPIHNLKLRCNHQQCLDQSHQTFMVHGTSVTKRHVGEKKSPSPNGKNHKQPKKKNVTVNSYSNSNNYAKSSSSGSSNTTNPKKKKSDTGKRKFYNKGPVINSKQLMQAKAINKELIESASASEVLDVFTSKGGAKGVAGADVFNSVNYSTFMHRLARFATYVDYSKKNEPTAEEKRKTILSDPRTAILIASLAEALVQPSSNKMLVFNNRELANLGWAVAKLKVAPPSSIYPITRLEDAKSSTNCSTSNTNVVFVTKEALDADMRQTATKVRQQVLQVAKERSMVPKGVMVKSKWIPTMSQLSGKLLDTIAAQVLQILDNFNSQELANLLYAFASAGRADVYFFDQLSTQLVKNLSDTSPSPAKQKNFQKNLQPKPQEFR